MRNPELADVAGPQWLEVVGQTDLAAPARKNKPTIRYYNTMKVIYIYKRKDNDNEKAQGLTGTFLRFCRRVQAA